MTKKNYYIVALMLIILSGNILTSCRTTSILSIDIPKPGLKELPEHIQSLALISRVPLRGFHNYNADSLQKAFYLKEFNTDTLINDFTSVDTTLLALSNLLFESKRYDVVVPLQRHLAQNRYFTSPSIDWDEIDQLCKTFKTDAVLSLEQFSTRVITSFGQKEIYVIPLEYSRNAIATMSVICETYFKVYDNTQKKIIYSELVKDTLDWEDYDKSPTALFSRFTPVKRALAEAGISVALELADKIGIDWIPQKRTYFSTGKNGMKIAAQLIAENQLDSAMQTWGKITETTKSKSLKSKAEFNLALGYEISGDLDMAMQMALQSYQTMYRTITYNYLAFLKKRKDETQK